jgi:hypothetical protein
MEKLLAALPPGADGPFGPQASGKIDAADALMAPTARCLWRTACERATGRQDGCPRDKVLGSLGFSRRFGLRNVPEYPFGVVCSK